MNYLKVLMLAMNVSILVMESSAQNQLQFSGDFRARSEYRHGFSTLAAQNSRGAFFIDQRARLILNYTTPTYLFKLSLQDVRIWGNQPQLVREDGSMTAMHEAWGEVVLLKNLSFRVGRQEIALDDHRIFGNVDWLMQARSHDAGVIKFKNEKLEVQAGAAFNQEKAQLNTSFYSISNNYKALQFLWLNKVFGRVNSSVLILNNGKQGGTIDNYTTYFSQTFGTRTSFKGEKIKANAFYYHQVGKEADAITRINAFDAGIDLSYQINDKFNVGPGVEILSGNSQGDATNTNRAFNPFYGTNHKFNGFMDYFYVGNHINSVGLHDYYTHFNYQNKKISSSIQLHLFESDGLVVDPEKTGNMKRKLGSEIDFTLQYKFNPEVQFDAGYSHFFPTETLEAVKGGDERARQNWFWFMISFKPVFYKTPEQKP